MSEIKFACPHCAQHIACDDLYCGERIACPGCKGQLFIPPLAASIPLQSGKLALAVPVAAKGQVRLLPGRLEPWTEAEWGERAARTDGGAGSMLPFWALLILPLFLALVLFMHGAGFGSIAASFAVCALIAGFYLAKLHANSTAGTIARGILYTVGAVMVYLVLGLGLLFLGCLALA